LEVELIITATYIELYNTTDDKQRLKDHESLRMDVSDYDDDVDDDLANDEY